MEQSKLNVEMTRSTSVPDGGTCEDFLSYSPRVDSRSIRSLLGKSP